MKKRHSNISIFGTIGAVIGLVLGMVYGSLILWGASVAVGNFIGMIVELLNKSKTKK